MEAALPANSRVTIECTDPANLLSVIEPTLLERLPLRNLHWKSPSRPLRSIDTLNVAFTRTDDGQSNAAFGLRRHQIPGLRQTPYVKIFLFRCDDKEAYKESGRKQVRHWIKNVAPQSEKKKSSNSQEQHDAFEWLIVHVVLPETVAANEPRTSKHSSLGTTDSTDSVSSKSKWPGKSSSTIYEKLLADFNSSSKSNLDRVTQVRIPKNGSNKLPSVLAPAEVEEQWQDLVEKLKLTILASFDVRVAQYEEDIRERDNQRSLPGWNFCTFFMLKEGLSRGFENVGLLEDAMMGYDELGAGLDSVVKEQAMRDEGDTGTLLPFSKEMKDKIRKALDGLHKEEKEELLAASGPIEDWLFTVEKELIPFDTGRKDYRSLILANEVSALDFRTYIFSRHLELLRRRSNAIRPVSQDANRPGTPQLLSNATGSLTVLAEMTMRGTRFVNLAARTMRRDLYRAWGGQEGLTGQDLQTQKALIDNIVSSWTWAALVQLLSQTETPALNLPADFQATLASLAHRSVKIRSQVGLEDDTRTQLTPDQGSVNIDQDMFLLETYTGKMNISSVQLPEELSRRESLKPNKTGADQLASSRADLLIMARNVVEALGVTRGYVSKDSSLKSRDSITNGISNEDSLNGHGLGESSEYLLAGLEAVSLQRIAMSQDAFSAAYESLTVQACRHFVAAEKFKRAGKAVVDLGLMKYHSEDFQAAADYFSVVANIYGKGSWGVLTESVLKPYAECLKRLDQQEEYVRCLLAILIGAAHQNAELSESEAYNETLQKDLDDLWSSAESLQNGISVPFLSFFELGQIDGCIYHFEDRDGFSLTFGVRLRLPGKIGGANAFLLSLSALDEEGPPKKITLKNAGAREISKSFSILRFESKVTAYGWFEFSTLELSIGKILFQLSLRDLKKSREISNGDREIAQFCHPVLLYPASRSINVKALAAPYISLGQPRKLSLQVQSNGNDIRDCKISTKAATAGLRLRIHETKIANKSDKVPFNLALDKDQDIRLSNIPPGHFVDLDIPYTLENSDTMILVANLQLTYSTAEGTFIYYESISINTILPISVNVQEVFKATELYSRFTISPATLVPLQLRACTIEGGHHYKTELSFAVQEPLSVFPKQPASLLYRITKRTLSNQSTKPSPLPLVVDYRCTDEIILSSLSSLFTADVAESSFSNLSSLLSAHLTLAYRTKWTEQDLEVALLLEEIDIWPYEDIGWEEVLSGLSKDRQRECATWLKEWHGRRSSARFDVEGAPIRRISIPIEIPAPSIVVTAELKLQTQRGGTAPVSVSIGQPVFATLNLSYSEHWREDGGSDSEQLHIFYEVTAPPEQWLIGGRRKGSVPSRPDENRGYQVLLIPQRAGHLILPAVEVKCVKGVWSAEENTDVPFELDLKSQAKSVLVILGLEAVTLRLGGEGGSSVLGGETIKEIS